MPVRPTTDVAKEALFNILHNQYGIEFATALDLFSGTGSIAYELHSRGCKQVTAVDKNNKCTIFIEQTKDKLQMDNFNVVQANCFSFLKTAWNKYDIIFADPPYDMPDFEKIVELVFNKELLKPEGVLIVEHSKDTSLSHLTNYINTRNYGNVHFSFFEG